MTALAEQFRLTQQPKHGARGLRFPQAKAKSPRLNADAVKVTKTKGGPMHRATSQADVIRDLYLDAIKASSALGAALATAKKQNTTGYDGLLDAAGVETGAAQAFINLAARSQKPTGQRAPKSTSTEIYGRV